MKKILCIVLSVLMVILPLSACGKGTDMDPEKYSNYVCYDSLLTCIGDISETVEIKRNTGRTYRFTYRKIPDVSDDQFIFTTMYPVSAFNLLGTPEFKDISYVFQNPDNYIDVLEEWTIKEIQIYYRDHAQRLKDEEENSCYPRTTGILATTNDETCIQELLSFITIEEDICYGDELLKREDFQVTYYDWDGNSEVSTELYIRIIFNESEYIVWNTMVHGISNQYNQDELYFQINRDRTVWDVTDKEYGIGKRLFTIGNLPALEAFLLEAVQTLREGTE